MITMFMAKEGRPRGRPPKYPWEKWFKSKTFTLKRGVHYTCKTNSMTTLVRQQAAARNLHCSVTDVGGGLKVAVGKGWVLK